MQLLEQVKGHSVVMGDGCWVGGDRGKYMNGAVCLGLCGVHLAVVHSNKNALFGLRGVSVNFSEVLHPPDPPVHVCMF